MFSDPARQEAFGKVWHLNWPFHFTKGTFSITVLDDKTVDEDGAIANHVLRGHAFRDPKEKEGQVWCQIWYGIIK